LNDLKRRRRLFGTFKLSETLTFEVTMEIINTITTIYLFKNTYTNKYK